MRKRVGFNMLLYGVVEESVVIGPDVVAMVTLLRAHVTVDVISIVEVVKVYKGFLHKKIVCRPMSY